MVQTQRKPQKRKTSRQPVRRRRTSRTRHGFFGRYPRWAWWIGGIAVVLLYVGAFYYFFVGPTGFRWRALYGDAEYPDGYEIRGIDISHYQGTIDWEQLKDAMIKGCPLRFIIIKSTEGSSRLDENFRENFNQARDYGFIRGVYHFWSNKSSAREQAYFFLDKVHLTEGDLPPVLDIEHKPADKSVEEFQRDVLTWLHIVEDRYHVKPIIYTYYKFKEQYLGAPVFDDYPYWIAHYYVDKVQYRVNGSSGNIPMPVSCQVLRVMSTSISTMAAIMICASCASEPTTTSASLWSGQNKARPAFVVSSAYLSQSQFLCFLYQHGDVFVIESAQYQIAAFVEHASE